MASARVTAQRIVVINCRFIVAMQIYCVVRMTRLAVHVIQIRVAQSVIRAYNVRIGQNTIRDSGLLLLIDIRGVRRRLATDIVRLQDTIFGIEKCLIGWRMIRRCGDAVFGRRRTVQMRMIHGRR